MMSDICPYMDMLMDMLMMANDICPYMDMLMDNGHADVADDVRPGIYGLMDDVPYGHADGHADDVRHMPC